MDGHARAAEHWQTAHDVRRALDDVEEFRRELVDLAVEVGALDGSLGGPGAANTTSGNG